MHCDRRRSAQNGVGQLGPASNRRVVDSRQRGHLRLRVYRLEDGRRVRTIELPATVLKAIASQAKLDTAIAAWLRGEASRARVVQVQRMLEQGYKPRHIADELGITESRVRQIRGATKRDEQPTNLWSIW